MFGCWDVGILGFSQSLPNIGFLEWLAQAKRLFACQALSWKHGCGCMGQVVGARPPNTDEWLALSAFEG